MITYPIPHTANYIPTRTAFSAVFNANNDGKYTFDSVQEIIPMEINNIYYIDSVIISGNISDAIFQNSIHTNFSLHIRQRIGTVIQYQNALPLYRLSDTMTITAFSKTNKLGNFLDARLTGRLDQIAETVGKSPITINLSFNIYAINDKVFNVHFRDVNKMSLSSQINKG